MQSGLSSFPSVTPLKCVVTKFMSDLSFISPPVTDVPAMKSAPKSAAVLSLRAITSVSDAYTPLSVGTNIAPNTIIAANNIARDLFIAASVHSLFKPL